MDAKLESLVRKTATTRAVQAVLRKHPDMTESAAAKTVKLVQQK